MRKLRPILLASFFFSFHLALVSYLNSSMLGTFFTPKGIGIVFALSSLLSLFYIARAARLIERWGAVRYTAALLGLSAALLLILGFAQHAAVAALAFIPYFAINTLVFYGFDVFLEHFSSPETTGNTRGVFLTCNNIAWVCAPALVGFLEVKYGFGVIYFFAAFATLASLATVFVGERRYQDPKYAHVSLQRIWRVLRTKGNMRGSIVVAGLLQLFYVWMVIYSPLYLTRTLGLSWETVGIILSVMLIPFILFQYPAGRIADKFSSERTLIAIGLLIMGVATMVFALIDGVSLLAIALVLFLTRVGASIVEVSNESYFFKQVSDRNTGAIAVFRNMTPLAYLVGPVLAFALLGWNNYSVLFFMLGLFMLGGAAFALTLRDIEKMQ